MERLDPARWWRPLRVLAWTSLAILIAGCIAVPPPVHDESVVYGRALAEDDVRATLAGAESALAVKARLGEPVANFGPHRVLVYLWTVRKGVVLWVGAGGLRGGAGAAPLLATHLLFVAFDVDGRVLKVGTADFQPLDTLAAQVRQWLLGNGLTARVAGPRAEPGVGQKPVLYVYHPCRSSCPFPTFDAGIFKPAVEVDGAVIGDLGKGEYLAVELEPGAHTLTIDPVPGYRFAGQDEDPFVKDLRRRRVRTVLRVRGEPDEAVYVETYLCTGTGKIEMHAVARDPQNGLRAISDLQPAW